MLLLRFMLEAINKYRLDVVITRRLHNVDFIMKTHVFSENIWYDMI